MLSTASPVFKSMLSARFQEGTHLRTHGSAEIPLPEDDAKSVEIICQIAHHRNDSVLRSPPTLDELLSIAKLCDKYNLGQLLRPHARGWVADMLKEVNDRVEIYWSEHKAADDKRERLLFAAYCFGHAESLALVGDSIITKSAQKVGIQLHQAGMVVAPRVGAILDALRRERKRNRAVINDTIAEMLEDELKLAGRDCGSDCVYVQKRLKYVLDGLHDSNLWPHKSVRNCSLETLWDAMKAAPWAKFLLSEHGIEGCGAIGCPGEVDSNLNVLADQLLDLEDETRKEIRRMCLDCVRQGGFLREECEHSAGPTK